jgi:DNA-binding LacI/PurR family transcriptional regulator
LKEARFVSDTKPARRLSYKFQRLRERIRNEIIGGEMRGKFPGERELARRYQVNAKTVSKALSDLMSEGLLVREVGRGTYVREDLNNVHPGRKSRNYRWIVDNLGNLRSDADMFALAEAEASQAGHRLSIERVDVTGNAPVGNGWLAPSALKGIDGVVVFNSHASPEFVADLSRRRIPVVMADAVSPSFKSNTVRPDYARGAFELTEYLADAGHERILLAVAENGHSYGCDAERGWRAALDRRGLPALKICKGGRHGFDEVLRGADAPTACVAVGTLLAEALIRGRAGAPGVSVETAVAVLAEPGQTLDSVPAAVAGYVFDARAIAQWSIRLLLDASPGQSPREVVVPGTLQLGQHVPVDRAGARDAAPGVCAF